MFLLMLACATLDPDAVHQEIAESDLAGAYALLAEAQPEDITPTFAALQRWAFADAEANVLNLQSREILRETAAEALNDGRPQDAQAAVISGLSTWPDDTAFLQLAAQLSDATPPERQAAAFRELAKAAGRDSVRGRSWAMRGEKAAIESRYADGVRDGTVQAQAGINLNAAQAILATIDAEYIDALPVQDMLAGGRAQVGWFSGAEGVRAAWSGVGQLSGPVEGSLADAVVDVAEQARSVGVPTQAVIYEWVAGALRALDPWTRAVWPSEVASWSEHHAGVYVGIGVELAMAGEQVRVVTPLFGAPAFDAGLQQNDLIVAMADATGSLRVAELPVEQRLATVQAGMRGAPGTALKLTVSRRGADEEIEVVRGPVTVETVQGLTRQPDNRWDIFLDEGLAYVRILGFRDATEADFDALTDGQRIEGLILDLRGNGGGDMNAAVQIADRFIADGLLADWSGRVLPNTGSAVAEDGSRIPDWNEALPGHGLEGVAVVVMIDSDTASAAEIVAGALQQRVGAVVVGEPSFGKGYGQALRELPEHGVATQFTNIAWTLPDGRRLEPSTPIVPDLSTGPVTPGMAYQLGRLRGAETALRAHADGSPIRAEIPDARPDLAPLSADPTRLAAEVVLRSQLQRR